MKTVFVAAFASIVLATSGGALAQRRYPVQADVPSLPGAQVTAMSGLQEMANCLVAGNGPAAMALLAAEPGSIEETRARKRLMPSNETPCLRFVPDLRMENTLLRGSLAEVLYEDKFGAPPAATAAASSEASPSGGKVMWTNSTPADKGVASYLVAKCYVRRDPAGSHALLATTVGSKEERAALRGMSPDFSACTSSGRTATLNRLILRYAVAEALYQRALSLRSPN
jgi:hypothetical protein